MSHSYYPCSIRQKVSLSFNKQIMSQSFHLNNALLDKFCFPMYIFPIFAAFMFIIQKIFHRCLSKYPLYKQMIKYLTIDFEEELQMSQDEFKKLITKAKDDIDVITTRYFLTHTPLPVRIIHLIIKDFCNYDIHIFTWYNKQFFKIMTYYNLYTIIAICDHIFCLFIIIWINVDWIKNNKIDSWNAFQSIWITVITAHPSTKLFNWVWTQYLNEKLYTKKGRKSSCVMTTISVYMLMVYLFIFALGGMLVYEVESLFYHFPLWFVFILIIIIIKMEGINLTFSCVWITLPILFYIHLSYVTSSMSCVYSGKIRPGRWYLCLEAALYSPYCDSRLIHIDWDDWKAIVLLISWIFF